MYVVISLVMAVAPALFLLFYYNRQDALKPEPKGLISKIFFFGILIIIPVFIIELILDIYYAAFFSSIPLIYYFFKSFVVASASEELFKLLVVMWFAYKSPHFDEAMDGIIYCVVASLGFACFENVLYVWDKGVDVALLRAFTAVPLHAIASGIMGYYIGKAKFAGTKHEEKALIRKGYFVAVIIHGVYDFVLFGIPVLTIYPALLIIPIIIGGFINLRKKIKIAINDDILQGRTLAPGEA